MTSHDKPSNKAEGFFPITPAAAREISHGRVRPLAEHDMRVMLVDDHDFSHELFDQVIVHGRRYQVTHAYDADEARVLLAERVPHVICLDYHMPRIDGYQLAQRLRADRRTHHVPLVAVGEFGPEHYPLFDAVHPKDTFVPNRVAIQQTLERLAMYGRKK